MATSVQWKARLLFAALLCAGAIAGVGWYLWSSSRYTTYQIVTHEPVHGLIVDSPVELHGVEIGKVTRIQLIDDNTVRIRLSAAEDAPVSKATVATITARGLAARGFAGYVYIALENTGTDSGPLSTAPGQAYPVISSAPSRIDTIDTTAAIAVAQVEQITKLAQSAINETTVTTLKRLTSSLQQITQWLASVLDEKTMASLKHTLASLQEITATLAANSKRLDSLVANSERDSREIQPLLTVSNAMIRELNTQVLPQVYRAMGNLENLARVFDGLATRLASNPSVLLRGTATPPGPGER
jgi:phospholipid/cholesterol/gamma-HCH transport system substrate-binding protein